jgi:hypothetical protein
VQDPVGPKPPDPLPAVDQFGPPAPPVEAEREVPAGKDPSPAPLPVVEPSSNTNPALSLAPATTALPAFSPSYRALADVEASLLAWAVARPAHARAWRLADGEAASAPVLEFGAAGGLDFDARPCVLLIGGLDGQALEGGEAVLAVTHSLLEQPERLPANVCFLSLPWAAPEALSGALAGKVFDGRNARALDEDADGAFDEDGPDDLDGDGQILDLLIEDSRGLWARSKDLRFLVRAEPGDQPRYTLVKEGRDDDGDGRFNEDGPGGVVLDMNFPVGRRAGTGDARLGPYPLSEPLTRALAELATQRRVALALFFQGQHGQAAAPGGTDWKQAPGLVSELDRAVYARTGELFSVLTRRRQPSFLSLREARGEARPGAAIDWFYASLGVLALEVAPWGPRAELREEGPARDARFARPDGAGAPGERGGPSAAPRWHDGARPPAEADREWALWLDNVHGGLGFSAWRPIELGGARATRAWIGGWEPRTRANPPPESMARCLTGLDEFALSLSSALPRLDLRVSELTRRGEVVSLRAALRNAGHLPTGLEGPPLEGRSSAGRGAVMTLELPSGARLLAGAERVPLGRLAGQELSTEAAWVVFAPQGSVLQLRAEAPWAAPHTQELRP